MVKARLACPWQLVRLAVKAAESDAASRIAATPYAVAVTIVLDEIEGMVRDLRAGLKRGAGEAVNTLLKSIHDAARGLRSELDLATDLPWGRQLAAIRSEISIVLKAEIEVAARPGPALAAAASDERDADRHARRQRCRRDRSADRIRRALPQLCERTGHQRDHAQDLQRIAALSRHRARKACSTACAMRAQPIAGSGSRRSMPRCASAPRCSARNTHRCCPRRPRSRPTASAKPPRPRRLEVPPTLRVRRARGFAVLICKQVRLQSGPNVLG